MGLKVQIFVCMCSFSVDLGGQGAIRMVFDLSVQERENSILFYLKCELDRRFNTVEVVVECLDLLRMESCAGVIHISLPEWWWIWERG